MINTQAPSYNGYRAITNDYRIDNQYYNSFFFNNCKPEFGIMTATIVLFKR